MIFFFLQIIYAQTGWVVEEETYLEGSISGSVQVGSIFKTSSGNIYEVTGLTLQLVLELSPNVLVLRKGDTFKLIVEGFDEPLICRRVKESDISNRGSFAGSSDVIESKIDGEFNGWDGETIFKLTNGQIWQQSSYSYTYRYKYRPSVTIFKSGGVYKMKVDGVEKTINVVRLK